MRIVIDMNLSPEWEATLREAGHCVMHWSRIGPPGAADEEILAWAQENEHTIFTHDLDFGAILAAMKTACPSIIQIRTVDVSPRTLGSVMVEIIDQFTDILETGAVISVDESKARARILPLR